MTSKEREDFAALTNKARTVREVWLREREEHLALQCAANAEIRKGWSDSTKETDSDRPDDRMRRIEVNDD
jgi:hypothetical protein